MTNKELENEVLTALGKVIDPEINMDLVNLGLIYGIEVEDGNCIVTMTLTTMGCPLSKMIDDEIYHVVTSIDGIDTCQINLVWHPIWSIDKMSRFAKITLGIHG